MPNMPSVCCWRLGSCDLFIYLEVVQLNMLVERHVLISYYLRDTSEELRILFFLANFHNEIKKYSGLSKETETTLLRLIVVLI
jgi:hypothetical protein